MSETDLVETETAGAPSARALALAAELVALRDVARRVADMLSGRYMELLWDLRREWPAGPIGDDGFSVLLARHGIDGEQARRRQSPAWVDRMLQLVDLMGGHIDRIFCDFSGDENSERAED